MKKYLLLILASCVFFSHSFSQNLTGTWEGTMSGGEKLKVFVQMQKQELCGYTYDVEMFDPNSYCKANFRGWFDKNEKVWVLVGTSFIENSGGHILMILRLWHQDGDPADVLKGTEESKYSSTSMFGMGNNRSSVRLKRISNKIPPDLKDCFPKVKKPVSSTKAKEVSVVPASKAKKTAEPIVKSSKTAPPPDKKPTVSKPVNKQKDTMSVSKPVAKKAYLDTTKSIPVKPQVQVSKEQSGLAARMNSRKKTAFSHIVVNDRNITLTLYDNGIVDNDTVSVFYNGRLIAGKKGLSEKPQVIHLELDEHAALHEIVMFAENLGSIAPNTALIVVTVGNKRYELHSSSSLTENAVLTFEYQKKEP